jgi:LysR family transcriptional regulator, cyn operon transcriptional activator
MCGPVNAVLRAASKTKAQRIRYLPGMNLRQLHYLVATVDTGTMTAAARRLHVAQPALSRAVHVLEAELGVTLFERDGRRLRLTDAGRDVAAAARRVLDEVELLEAAAAAHRLDGEHLEVVTTPTLETLLARHLLPAFYDVRPDVSVRVHRANGREEVHAVVAAGEAILGLSDLPIADGLEMVVLGQLEIVVLSSAEAQLPASMALTDLDGMRLILPSPGTTRRAEFDALFDGLGVTPVVALESDERSSWMEGMLAGIGAVLWYGERAGAAVERGARLTRFEPAVTREIGMSFRPGQLDGAARVLVEVAKAVGISELVDPT